MYICIDENENPLLRCESCNFVEDIKKYESTDILDTINAGKYSLEIEKTAMRKADSNNFIEELIKRHVLFKTLKRY